MKKIAPPKLTEHIAERFETMHANGDKWISTVAAAALVRGITKEHPPAPTDTIRVACITLDGSTLTVPVKTLADVVPDLISESGDVYTLTIKEITVAEYEALGEFNGF